MEAIKKNAHIIVTTVLLIHLAVSLFISREESMTFDEKAHIPAAYSYVAYHDMRLNPEHPPLLKDLAGLPLLFLPVTFPLNTPEWENGINEQWTLGDIFINCSRPEVACNDADAILFWSRLPILLVTLLLGFFLYKWTKELGGALAGVLAVFLFAFDPNILAHNHYVTTDIGIAAFIFIAFYFFIRFLKSPTGKNIFWAGIFLGLAELTKFSAILLFPIFGLFTIVYALTRQKHHENPESTFFFKTKELLGYSFKYALSILVAFGLICIVYAINTYSMPGEKLVAAANLYLGQDNIAANIANEIVISTSHHPLLKPYSEYFLGVFMVFARVASGNVHYFMGEVTQAASPWYFPVVFVLKETLPFLSLLLFTSLYALSRFIHALSSKPEDISFTRLFALSFQHKITSYLAVFFILFYSYISITGNLNIGFRHLFPIMPFLYMFMAKVTLDFYQRHKKNKATHRVLNTLLGVLVFAIVATPLASFPSYLSYFNAVAGGHTAGYHYVTDSNYDWGQDLKRLATFVETHNACSEGKATETKDCLPTWGYPKIDTLRVDYFGGSSPSYYLKEKHTPWWDKRTPEAGWYAISVFFYQESIYKKDNVGYQWLTHFTPLTKAGDSFFIYYISPADLESIER